MRDKEIEQKRERERAREIIKERDCIVCDYKIACS